MNEELEKVYYNLLDELRCGLADNNDLVQATELAKVQALDNIRHELVDIVKYIAIIANAYEEQAAQR